MNTAKVRPKLGYFPEENQVLCIAEHCDAEHLVEEPFKEGSDLFFLRDKRTGKPVGFGINNVSLCRREGVYFQVEEPNIDRFRFLSEEPVPPLPPGHRAPLRLVTTRELMGDEEARASGTAAVEAALEERSA